VADRPAPEVDDPTLSGRRVLVLGLMSVVLAALAPPVGMLMGGWTLVVLYRGRRRTRGSGTPAGASEIVGGVAAGGAILLGAALTASLVLFWGELSDFGSCRAGANTRVAQDRCQAELEDAVLGRLGLD
jgi:hypothetical protein